MKHTIVFVLGVLIKLKQCCSCCIDCNSLAEDTAYFIAQQKLDCALNNQQSSMTAGTPIITYTLNAAEGLNQVWFLKRIPNQSTFLIINAVSQLAVTATSMKVTQEMPSCSCSQQFSFVPSSNGACYMVMAGQKVNNLFGNPSATTGCNASSVVLSNETCSLDQQWYFIAETSSEIVFNFKLKCFSQFRLCCILFDFSKTCSCSCKYNHKLFNNWSS